MHIRRLLEVVDVGIDKQTNCCGEGELISTKCKDIGYVVLFLIIPMFGNAI